MPVRDMRTRLSLDGETSYKQALSEMTKGLSVLNSELRLNSEQYKGNEDSIEALTSRGVLLEQKLLSQKDKVDLLRQAYEKSVTQNGEASAKTQDLKIKLNNAETALVGMDRELKNNASALETSTKKNAHFKDSLDGGVKSGKGFGDVIGELSGKFGISLPSDITTSLNSISTLDGALLEAAGAVAGAAAFAAALIAVGDAALDMTVKQAEAADDIVTLSLKTGVAIETLQALNYAQDLIDVSTETVTSSMAKNIRSMDDARKGNKELAEAYRDLHVRITGAGGKLRDSEDVYWDVIDALGKMKNETERDALAMTLLGRSAQELNPLIKIGSAGWAEYDKQAEEAGAKDEARALTLAAVDDHVRTLNNDLKIAKDVLAEALAPTVSDFIDQGTDLIHVLSEVVDETGLDDFLVVVLEAGTSILQVLEPIAKILGPLASVALKPIALALGIVADALTIVASLLGIVIESIKWLVGASPDAGQKIASYWSNIKGVFSGEGATSAALKMYGIGNNAEGTSNWRGGLTWVGENGPEVVNLPRGSQVIPARRALAAGTNNYIMQVNSRDMMTVARMTAIFEKARQEGRAR